MPSAEITAITEPGAARPLRAELSEFLRALEAAQGLTDDPDLPPLTLPSGAGGRLDRLSDSFELNSFEQTVLALALAQEIHPFRTRHLLAPVMGVGDPLQATLTPFACLEWFEDADPAAFGPERPLLRWGLLRAGPGLTGDASLRALSVAPGVLAYVQGASGLDPDLRAVATLDAGPVTLNATLDSSLSDSQQTLLEQARRFLNRAGTDARGLLLYGLDPGAMQAVAAHALTGRAGDRSNGVLRVDVAALAAAPEQTDLLTAVGRELRLAGHHLLIDATGVPGEGGPQTLDTLSAQLLDLSPHPAAIMSADPMPLTTTHALLTLEVRPPTAAEQRERWALGLGVGADHAALRELGDQFTLNLGRIDTLVREARAALPGNASHAARLERAWDVARTANRRLLGALASRIETQAGWDDLILPDADRAALEQIAAHVRHRSQVYEDLGMARPGRGRSITALFSGPSGTGKTLSAEVLARDLNLDLYRVDLSSTVSKYIGETEKNLKKIFDAADQGGCVLLFDEADSVFGKRGEVRDSNDRYANTQVNYLLQRLESFNGLALLTTNLESSMDVAFMRRLQFVINFRAPQAPERERLWRGAFPAALDTGEVDFARLAQADVSGGNIRSVVMNAVFMSVARGVPVSQALVEEALHLEYRKLGRLVL